jgi:hypothetical protein
MKKPNGSQHKHRGDFAYAHMLILAKELRESKLNIPQKELLAAFLARVFKRRVIGFDLDNFMSVCLGLTEGKNAAHVHDSFINGCICQKRERCDIPGPAISTVGAD